MSRLTLDTSAYSHLCRGDERLAHLVDSASWIGLPAVFLGELRHGFLLGTRAEANEDLLQRFLAEAVVDVQLIDDAASRCHADILGRLKRAGTPVPTNDAWIAAVALRDGTTVVTCDAHFERIALVRSRVVSILQ